MAKILLVEDDKSLREIYGVRLMAEGYEIVSAGDGEEALAMAIKERPDLIVSDVMMPKISGFDMLDILRSTTETKDVKVIMMTALSSDDQRARGEALGADRYLVKSQVGIEDVVRTVHDVLADTPGSTIAAPSFAPQAPSAAPAPTPAPAAPVSLGVSEPAPVPSVQPQPVMQPQQPVPTPQPSFAPQAQQAPATAPSFAPQPAQPAPAVASAPAPTPIASPQPTQVAAQPAQAPQVIQPQQPQPAFQPAPQTQPTPAPAVMQDISAPPAPQQPAAFQQQPVQAPAPVAAPVAPAAPANPLPQPTAPFSSPAPASLGERVIEPLTNPAEFNPFNTDINNQMEQALGTQPAQAQTPPQTPPTPPAA